MSIINFDLSISPDPVKLNFTTSLTEKEASIALDSIDLSISAKPSTGTIVGGAIAGAILGGFVGGGITVAVVEGVAAAIGPKLTDKVKDAVNDQFPQKATFSEPLGYSIEVEGVTIRV